MSGLYITLTIIVVVACLAIIPAILLQTKRDAGFSGAAGGGAGQGSSPEQTQFDKSKKRTTEGKLERLTKLLAVVFMVLTLVISLMA